MTEAPALHLAPLATRYQVELDEIGWRIGIAGNAYVRPDDRGRITHWVVAEDHKPEEFRRDIELMRVLIAELAAPHERWIFREPMGDRRYHALEALCEAGNEAWHAGEVNQLIGREQ